MKFQKGDHIVNANGGRYYVHDTLNGHYFLRQVHKGRLKKKSLIWHERYADSVFEKVVRTRLKTDRKRPTSALSPKIKRRSLRL